MSLHVCDIYALYHFDFQLDCVLLQSQSTIISAKMKRIKSSIGFALELMLITSTVREALLIVLVYRMSSSILMR
ncbi:hypothetical protein BU24DRAFT_424518 [Aaosphaeria arxii CBS 175.79]|uniref:Uncharacterized protein n=1 Tax=Aaosphaeria arxii CBS 175.79 TaxID=1450172 RepID=A0A6A5XMF9_9PLEO|nr:uncharacterized protein BU24DRAFT_424518 [Aaosphaeria arxii CBS 175.79]KAF2013514.1 hypothetical protein BU24DRAFT_424518 [Aaosphaeria arxii CBS 175.79]